MDTRASARGVMRPSDKVILDELTALAVRRGQGKTFCPSEVARALTQDPAADWRGLMPRVRQVAALMPALEATQKGQPVDPLTAKGPIRLGLAKT